MDQEPIDWRGHPPEVAPLQTEGYPLRMPDDRSADPSRRQFFRVFSRQTVAGAGSLIGTVNELRQTSATAAQQLLGIAELTDEPAPIGIETAFRSPYRFTGDSLVIVDQRDLPAKGTVLVCRTADDAAAAVRAGAAGGGPVLGQIAAYAMVLAVTRTADRPAHARRSALRLAASTLRAARFNQRSIRSSIERMEAVDASLDDDVDARAHIEALRGEAETIALDAALDHGRLGQVGAELLADAEALLLHGDGGPMSGGLVGTSFAVLAALTAAERRVHVWLTEAAPTMEGARTGAWQLAANDVPHTIVADTAVSWLLGARRIDAAILRADWLCSNGDIAAPVGSLNVARLASTAGVPVYACVAQSVIDPNCTDGKTIPTELRAPVEGRPGPRLDPAADVVPADLVTGLITASGVRPPTAATA
jgi:methylthioribose-1-phosphate isomerase